MLRDVSSVIMKTTIMGNKIDFPIGIAPTSVQKMAHPEGEVATAKGNVFFITLLVYQPYLRHVEGSLPLMFQLY